MRQSETRLPLCRAEASGWVQIWQASLLNLLIHHLPWALPGSLCWTGHGGFCFRSGSRPVYWSKHQVSIRYISHFCHSTGILQDAFWCGRATLGLTLPFVFVKLPGSERGARWRVWNRGAASGSNPDCRSGVCSSARLVDGSYRSWCWGERVVQRLYRVALCSYVSCTVNAVVVVSVPESGFVFCFHRYVRERIRRPGPTFHRSVQCTADGDPGWTAQSGPAGPGWVCIHSSSLCSSATLYCHKYLLSAFTNICTWSWHYLKPFGVLKH